MRTAVRMLATTVFVLTMMVWTHKITPDDKKSKLYVTYVTPASPVLHQNACRTIKTSVNIKGKKGQSLHKGEEEKG